MHMSRPVRERRVDALGPSIALADAITSALLRVAPQTEPEPALPHRRVVVLGPPREIAKLATASREVHARVTARRANVHERESASAARAAEGRVFVHGISHLDP